MKLNAEQLEQVRLAKAANQTRATVRFTDDQRQNWQLAAGQELAGRQANISQLSKLKAATEQPGLFGDLRRAIFGNRRPLHDLAQEIGVAPQTLSDFCSGEADLSPATIDRLAESLGLRLMQEIRR